MTRQAEDVSNTHPLRLLDSRARQGREPMSSELDQKAALSISANAQQVQPNHHTLRAPPAECMLGVIHSHHVSLPHTQSTPEHP